MQRGFLTKTTESFSRLSVGLCLQHFAAAREANEKTQKLKPAKIEADFPRRNRVGSSFFNSERHRGNSRSWPTSSPVRLKSQMAGEA